MADTRCSDCPCRYGECPGGDRADRLAHDLKEAGYVVADAKAIRDDRDRLSKRVVVLEGACVAAANYMESAALTLNARAYAYTDLPRDLSLNAGELRTALAAAHEEEKS